MTEEKPRGKDQLLRDLDAEISSVLAYLDMLKEVRKDIIGAPGSKTLSELYRNMYPYGGWDPGDAAEDCLKALGIWLSDERLIDELTTRGVSIFSPNPVAAIKKAVSRKENNGKIKLVNGLYGLPGWPLPDEPPKSSLGISK